MLTKLQAGGAENYDVLSPVNSDIKALVAAELTEPFDLSLLKNRDKLLPDYEEHPDIVLDGEHYMIPFVWGTDTVIHNKEHIPEVNSWGVLFDPKYKGRLAVQDSAMFTIGLTAIYLGFTDPSPFDLTDAQLEDVKQRLIEAKPLWRTIWTNYTDVNNLLIAGDVWAAQGFLAMVEPVRQQGVDVGWAFVDEGSMGWFSGITMVKGTSQRELIHKFADYCIGDTFMLLMFKETGYYPTTTAIEGKLTPAEVKAAKLDNPTLPSKQHWYRNPTNPAKWEEVWNEVKAA
jgi:putative spermidine/putrescine transport system substrate-binding protein/spermidine/putrescine transport system substrate-binding protein